MIHEVNQLEQYIHVLQQQFDEEILKQNEPMRLHTTFRTGGLADLYFTPRNIVELQTGISLMQKESIPYFILGNGSNLLVSDKGIAGVVIHIGKNMSQISVEGNTIVAEAGAMLSAVSAAALSGGLTGLEFASGIPGTVGGAISMNAGAYGGEMKDTLVSVRVLTNDLNMVELPSSALELSYRHSILPEKGYILLSATFVLPEGDPEKIKAYMQELSTQRREKQPLQYPSAGSTFKRPEGYFAGKLVQDAGLKGKSIGGAQVSEKHAGFLINTGDATTTDILQLIAHCQKEVQAKFGVFLDTEVKFIGRK